MRVRTNLLALAALVALSGCGGGGGGGGTTPAQPVVLGPTLRGFTNRTYRVVDLGKLSYYWPGWFLSPGAASISLDNRGYVVSAMNYVPYLWNGGTVSQLSGNFTAARALNDSGQVIGDTWSGAGYWPRHAGIWQDGKITDLGSLSTNPYSYSQYSYAFGINAAGQVVGESSVDSAAPYWWTTHAFLYTDGQMTDIGTLGGYYCRAVAVNNTAQVVGYGPTADNEQTHGFVWQNGTMTDLGTFPGGTYSQAAAINDNGQIVGYATKAKTDLFGSPPPRAALWQNGRITDLGTLGGPGAFATGINNDGTIIGSAETSELRASDLYYFGYYYDYYSYYGYGWNFGAANGGAPSGAANFAVGSGGGADASNVAPPPGGITGATNTTAGGAATGFAGGGSGRAARSLSAKGRATGDQRSYYVAHAFIYADGTMLDLNRLLPANTGWELTQTCAINAKGQIVGVGTFQGQLHGFILNPE